jgi:hypothetical protein
MSIVLWVNKLCASFRFPWTWWHCNCWGLLWYISLVTGGHSSQRPGLLHQSVIILHDVHTPQLGFWIVHGAAVGRLRTTLLIVPISLPTLPPVISISLDPLRTIWLARDVDCFWNVMAHAQKPDFVFRRNGRVHLNRRGRQFSRLLAADVWASAVVMLDTSCSEVVWRVLATHSIRQFPLHFPSRASPCVVTFQLDSIACYTRDGICNSLGILSIVRYVNAYRVVGVGMI